MSTQIAPVKGLTVQFRRWNCTVHKSTYGNDRTALVLNDTKDGERVLVATINVPDEFLFPGEVIIKDYSENHGIYQVLLDAGIISEELRRVDTGFVYGKVCKLLI